MSFGIEILSINENLYSHIESACESLNKVQEDFAFKIPSETLKGKLYLQKKENYKSEEVFAWLRTYRDEAKGHRPFIILVIDGPLSSTTLSNLFGNVSATEGLAVFTVYDFDQFVHDILRYCRYYLVRYALSFVEPKIKSHNDPERKKCIFHKKMYKPELVESLDSGHICEQCLDQLKPHLTNDIKNAIDKLLLIVSNQHPYSIVLKGGGVKGLAFAGALQELGKYFSFNSFAGTSAGALTAILLGAGYKPSELLSILKKKNFNEFKDASFIKGLSNLLTKGGYFPGDEIENWINKLLIDKIPNQLSEIKLSDLSIQTTVYASRIKDGTLVFDSLKERKETHASFAARCSMSIPLVFVPKLVDGIKVYDGGVRNNFPLQRFISDNKNRPFIGLYLKSGTKKKGSVFYELLNIPIDGEEIETVEANIDKVVVIDTYPIGTMDFNLSEDQKSFLVLTGKVAALQFLEKNHKDAKVEKKDLEIMIKKLASLKSKIS